MVDRGWLCTMPMQLICIQGHNKGLRASDGKRRFSPKTGYKKLECHYQTVIVKFPPLSPMSVHFYRIYVHLLGDKLWMSHGWGESLLEIDAFPMRRELEASKLSAKHLPSQYICWYTMCSCNTLIGKRSNGKNWQETVDLTVEMELVESRKSWSIGHIVTE
jgi:hypothetical protein